MKLSFKFKPELTDLQSTIIQDLTFHTTKLYNIANYDCVINGFKSYIDMEKQHKTCWHNEYLNSHNNQQCLKLVEQNWKSYFNAIDDYKENPAKYLGMPRPPKYKNLNDRKNEIIYTNFGVRFKNNTLMLSLSKAMQSKHGVKSLNFEVPNELQSLVDFQSLQQVKIKWDNSLKQWYLILIYVKQENILPVEFTNIMAIDLGLNNLATLTFLQNEDAHIFNGKPLKAVNGHINKQIAHLQSISMSMIGSEKHKDTKAITKLRRYRKNYIYDYMHKMSKRITELAYRYHCNTIVIGDIELIKQQMNYNKTFVQIPLQKLAQMIAYQAKLIGIEVVCQKENYTSGCSAFDLEPITKEYYNISRRIKRGLFRTNRGILVNSDVNGSLNILRKYLKDSGIPKLIQTARDRGCVDSPVKQQVA